MADLQQFSLRWPPTGPCRLSLQEIERHAVHMGSPSATRRPISSARGLQGAPVARNEVDRFPRGYLVSEVIEQKREASGDVFSFRHRKPKTLLIASRASFVEPAIGIKEIHHRFPSVMLVP